VINFLFVVIELFFAFS